MVLPRSALGKIDRPEHLRSKHLRTILAIALCSLVLIGVVWAATVQRIAFEHDEAIAIEMRQNANLVMALAEQTVRTLRGADQAAQALRHAYAERGTRLNLADFIAASGIDTRLFSIINLIDTHGDTIMSSVPTGRVNYADRDYFKYHQASRDDELHIGAPVLGRNFGTWQIPLSRRLSKPDGTFAGAVVIAIKPEYFTDLYERAEIGRLGVVALIGTDGVTRARRVGADSSLGQNVRGALLFAELAKHPAGSFTGPGALDGVVRIFSFRRLSEYPLIASVGTAETEALAPFRLRERNYLLMAMLASGFVLLLAGVLIAALSRQWRSVGALARSEAELRATFNQAAVGIAHNSLDGRFIRVNRKLCDMLGYSEQELLQRSAVDVTHPADAAVSADRMRQVLDESAVARGQELEKRYLHKDGSTVWASVALAMVRDERGQPQHFAVMVQDISERKKVEENMRRFRLAMDATSDAIYLIDAATMAFVDLNDAACRMQGRTREEIMALEPAVVLSIPREELRRIYDATIAAGAATEPVELLRPRADGAQAWVELRRRALRSGDGWTIVTVVRDVTERKKLQERLLQQAHYDHLTQVPNRALCYDRLAQALIQAKRKSGNACVMFVDLDRLKVVNDSLGHGIGDQLLQKAAQRLTRCVRAGDTVGRLGGDEFVLILPEVAKPKDCGPIAQKALDALAQPFSLDGHEVSVSASIGIATFPRDGETVDALIKNADSAMFSAKQAGGNRYCYYADPANGQSIAAAFKIPLSDIPA